MKHLFILVLSVLSFSLVQGQSLWKEIKTSDIQVRNDQEITQLPSAYMSYSLDYSGLKNVLDIAPSEDLAINIESDLIVKLPLPDGSMHSFRIYDSPTMAAGISLKYPEIKSFKGISTEDPRITVRFDTGHRGFHAAIHGPDYVYYIDPYMSEDKAHYITYDVKDDQYTFPEGKPVCGVEHDEVAPAPTTKSSNSGRTDIIPLRKYRLAIACTGEYGQWKGTVENAMSDINTGVNRMNQVFENEASIRYILVDNNDVLLNFDPNTDPYGNTASGGAMLSVNTGIVNTRIGPNSYDMGHVYNRSCDVGGVARLGSLCAEGFKGAAVTCHYNSDINFFAVSVTAHEMGHQMSAQHTFNHCNQSNESLGNGFEPGSGSTIMSYAGLCSNRNVQPVADDYYHTGSLIQIYNHSRHNVPDECGEKEDFGNHEPEIQMPELYKSNLYIPEDTYFYLDARGTDEDGDMLTYAWDAMNTGPLSPLGSPIGEAPHFRAFAPKTETIRYFPVRTNIFNGFPSNVEVLPEGDKKMLFNFTVRDNNPTGGTAVWESIYFNTVSTPEKFGVLYPGSQGISTKMGDVMDITWEVAETDQAPVNCKYVDILFSSTLSAEFDIYNLKILAENVLNDGAATVRLPDLATNKGRIIIKSRDNIFFDINTFGFQIKEPTEPTVYAEATPMYHKLCLPETTTINIETAMYGGDDTMLNLSVDGLPEGTIATFDNDNVMSGETTNLTLDFSNVVITDRYNPVITFIAEGVDTFFRSIVLDLTANDFSDMQPVGPASGASNVVAAPEFTWTGSEFADSYDFEVSDSPAFDNIIISLYNTTDLSYQTNIILDKSTVYYWRIRANNDCGPGSYTKVEAFATAVLGCTELTATNLPINISQSGTSITEAEFTVLTEGSIADVNLKKMKGDHQRNKDLRVSIVSPDGTVVKLFEKICPQQNFNCGFDDEANIAVKCPLGQGDTYRPIEELSAFNGVSTQGIWKLVVEDTKPGDGGQLKEAILELCSNVSVANPEIVTLSKVYAPTNTDTKIGSWNMSVIDADNDDPELTYTLVTNPRIGSIVKNGDETIEVGSTFTQADINLNRMKYRSTNIEGDDVASFVVTDGTGGWVGILDLDILVDFFSSTEEEDLNESISIFPNPSSGQVTISTNGRDLSNVAIVDIHGKTIITIANLSDGAHIDVSSLTSGVYILTTNGEGVKISKKLIVRE